LIKPLGSKLVPTGTGCGSPRRQALVTALKAPVCRRSGRSKRTLFQITFSQNRPIPPRITVFPLFFGSQAKPNCGAKFVFACLTLFPKPGNTVLMLGSGGKSLSVRPV